MKRKNQVVAADSSMEPKKTNNNAVENVHSPTANENPGMDAATAAAENRESSIPDIWENDLANAIDSIFTTSYFDPRGSVTDIEPKLKLTYSISQATPTVELQKAAIKRFSENIVSDDVYDSGHNVKITFELEKVILGSDTVTFIGNIPECHEPLVEIQYLVRNEWERASREVGVKPKIEYRGMEIILN